MFDLRPFAVLMAGLLLATAPAYGFEAGPGLVWKVSGEKNHLYLLGSVHMLRASDFPLADAAEAAYDDAEALVMELDMDDLDPLAVQALFFTHGRLADGETLQALLGEGLWAESAASAQAIGIDLSLLNKVKPWWAALTIAQLQLAKLGFNPEYGLESYFARRAAADDKPIDGLETAAYQVLLFDAMDMQQQTQLLIKSLDDASSLEQDMETLLAAWRAGHDEELASLQSEAFRDFPALYASLIRARNENWVEVLVSLLDDERDYLVVVGALHLVGEDSVVNGLERLGYKAARQ